MLIFSEAGFTDLAEAKSELAKIRTLADELERLVEGMVPSKNELADAPIMERWTLFGKPMPVLNGIAINPPSKKDRIAPWVTAPIAVAAENLGWVRCLDGLYQLGKIDDGKNFPWNEPSLRLGEWK